MKKNILLLCLLLQAIHSTAQDTTWVQTFTYDSISTRRATFDFPSSLQGKRFEKVLMYYNLKCDPATTWDQYNCGEWDYLTYSQIYQHTGILDSVKHQGSSFIANTLAPNSIHYRLAPYFDTISYHDTVRTGALTWGYINNVDNTGVGPFQQSLLGKRYQFIITAAEIASLGLTSGDSLTGISFNVLTAGGAIHHMQINGCLTSLDSLSSFVSSGLQNLYNNHLQVLATSQVDFIFSNPLIWDGVSNVVFDIETDAPTTSSDYSIDLSDTSHNLTISYDGRNGVFSKSHTNSALIGLSNYQFNDEITISFWAKGGGNTGINTSFLEALDSLGNRVLNIHFPWSDNTLYFDAGNNTGYDRIQQAMTGIDNQWNQWAFVKKQSTGEMKVFKNGVLWLSGTGKNRTIGAIDRIVLGNGAAVGSTWNWAGKIDEFQIWNKALDDTSIANWYNKKITPAHPDYANLLIYYDFDNEKYAKNRTGNPFLLMPSETGMIDFSELPVAGAQLSTLRPTMQLSKSVPTGSNVQTLLDSTFTEPQIVFEYTPQGRKFVIQNQFPAYIDTPSHPGNTTLTNSPMVYYEKPFEVINNFEIGRYITPYGINFDLGPNGFTYIYDVTDYQNLLLTDSVDFSAHNTQELINVKFAFVEGIPPRDILSFQEIWKWGSFLYKDMDNNSQLTDTNIALNPSAEMYKIRTRITGHGEQGIGTCCEWADKTHKIYVNGVERFSWDIWQTNECGDNPNIGQGGTWPYAREGWCPGDMVTDVSHDLTPFVNPGDTITLDYKIDAIPTGDQAQGNGNFIVSAHLMNYSAPNFQNDASIVDVTSPNKWEYYSKFNPACTSPKIIIQNTGALPLTKAKITVWITSGITQEFQWNGNLAFLEKEVVEIPIDNPYVFWQDYQGEHTFHAKISSVNTDAGELDEYPTNNEFTSFFDYPNYMPAAGFYVWFQTNNKPNENSYKLMDAAGNTIFERTQGTLLASTTYKDTFYLPQGCYSIVVYDSDGDGLSFWYSAQQEGETAGSFRIKKLALDGGPMLIALDADFGFYSRFDFSVGLQLGIDENKISKSLELYPNPNNGLFHVEASQIVGNSVQIDCINSLGQVVHTSKGIVNNGFLSKDFDLSALPHGYYTLRVVSEKETQTLHFVKE